MEGDRKEGEKGKRGRWLGLGKGPGLGIEG